MDFLNGQLPVFLGPQENGAPDDLEAVIVGFLDQAQFSLDVAVQEVDNPRIAVSVSTVTEGSRRVSGHAG